MKNFVNPTALGLFLGTMSGAFLVIGLNMASPSQAQTSGGFNRDEVAARVCSQMFTGGIYMQSLDPNEVAKLGYRVADAMSRVRNTTYEN